jgi:inner membrane protein
MPRHAHIYRMEVSYKLNKHDRSQSHNRGDRIHRHLHQLLEPQSIFQTRIPQLMCLYQHPARYRPVGKLFYPLARYLDRNFGHRTITHSLLCLITLALFISILEKIYKPDLHLSLIFTCSYTSHLIFDMMTKEGVPLLYPFNKTPCVIPGNPDRRLTSGNFKTESLIFCLLILIGMSCKSLFENGFWTTFDRAFGNLKHIHYEFIESTHLIQLQYDATYLGNQYQGEGYVVYAKPHQAIIFNKSGFIEINKDFHIHQLIPTKTSIKYTTKDLYFQNISPENLQQLIYEKPLLECHIQANTPIQYNKDNKLITSSQVDLTYAYNPPLIWEQKEGPALHAKTQALEHKIHLLLKDQHLLEEKRKTIQARIHTLSHTIPPMTAYQRQKATEELKRLKKELKSLENKQQHQGKIEETRFKLSQLKEKPEPTCSGYIQYLQLPN